MSIETYFILFVIVIIVATGLFIVKQQTAAIIERFGKFVAIRQPGLHIKIPLVDKVVGRMSLKILQLDVIVETKTKDDVFVKLKVSVQYKVVSSSVYDAFYKLDFPQDQITSYVFDVIRAEVPKMKLDDVFEKKNDIANAVKGELNEAMTNYGYDIIKALVTDIDPDGQVKEAMNRINAATRDKRAAEEEGEAAKIRKVKAAEAEAESKRLQGKGIADQRDAIINGFKDSIGAFSKDTGIKQEDVMRFVEITQYFDTMREMAKDNNNVIFMPHSATGEGIIEKFTAANVASDKLKNNNVE